MNLRWRLLNWNRTGEERRVWVSCAKRSLAVSSPSERKKKAIKCNWVYKVKYKPNGKIEKFKARLVAKGYSRVEGVDYSETYAPVIKFDSLRIICAMVTKAQIKMEQFDVCTAFLDGDLEWNLHGTTAWIQEYEVSRLALYSSSELTWSQVVSAAMEEDDWQVSH